MQGGRRQVKSAFPAFQRFYMTHRIGNMMDPWTRSDESCSLKHQPARFLRIRLRFHLRDLTRLYSVGYSDVKAHIWT
jgi:hypothetical protein